MKSKFSLSGLKIGIVSLFSRNPVKLYKIHNDVKLAKILKKKGKGHYLNLTKIEEGYEDYSLLHCVILNNRIELFQELYVNLPYFCDKEIIDNDSNKFGYTPLHLTCINDNISFFEALIKLGSNHYLESKSGLNCLHLASYNGSVRVLDYLNKILKVDLNKNSDLTPLHLACKNGKIDVVNYLIENKCKLNVLDQELLTPLEYCIIGDHLELFKILVEYYPNFQSYQKEENKKVPLVHLATTSKFSTKCLEYFLESQNNTNLICNNITKATPLHFSVMNKNFLATTLLLKKGALVNFTDYIGNSPLHYACYNLDLNIIKSLVDYGGDINLKNNSGLTPYEIINSSTEEDVNNVEVLKRCKLFVNGLNSTRIMKFVEDFDFKNKKITI